MGCIGLFHRAIGESGSILAGWYIWHRHIVLIEPADW